MANELDVNGDGKISVAEWIKFAFDVIKTVLLSIIAF